MKNVDSEGGGGGGRQEENADRVQRKKAETGRKTAFTRANAVSKLLFEASLPYSSCHVREEKGTHCVHVVSAVHALRTCLFTDTHLLTLTCLTT